MSKHHITMTRGVTVPLPPDERKPKPSENLRATIEKLVGPARRSILDAAMGENTKCVQMVVETLHEMEAWADGHTDSASHMRALMRALVLRMDDRWAWARKERDGND